MSEIIQFQNLGAKQNWIGGGFHDSSSGKSIPVISPYFNKEIATIPDSNSDDLDLAVKKANSAFPAWASTNIRDRAQVMFNLKTIMEKDIEHLAHLIALDNGKTVDDAKGSTLKKLGYPMEC